jgi:hypothetical protein
MTELDLDDHDEHGLIAFLAPDGTLTVDECCECELCDCPKHAGEAS